MQDHFRHLSFKSFPIVEEIIQSNEFWPLKSLFENLRVHRNSNSQNGNPFVSVWAQSLTFSYTPRSVNVALGLHF
jgi:hypothetical protein